ncbi:hypothetical protein GC194_00255 [bacterium]|nr:hypothetical protein [bacterium]
MKFVWIAITLLLGVIMFLFVQQHFILAVPYIVLHLVIIALLKHAGILNINIPRAILPLLFIALQLLYSVYYFSVINHLGLDEENFDKQIKFNLIRIGVLLVEYPLLLEFFKKPKFNRY